MCSTIYQLNTCITLKVEMYSKRTGAYFVDKILHFELEWLRPRITNWRWQVLVNVESTILPIIFNLASSKSCKLAKVVENIPWETHFGKAKKLKSLRRGKWHAWCWAGLCASIINDYMLHILKKQPHFVENYCAASV